MRRSPFKTATREKKVSSFALYSIDWLSTCCVCVLYNFSVLTSNASFLAAASMSVVEFESRGTYQLESSVMPIFPITKLVF